MTCVGILGTQTVMASGMFGKLAPVQVLAPEGPELKRVHDAYVALVRSATPTPELRTIFEVAGRKMVERGAQAILLGGTDLNAMFGNGEAQMPIIDCASIHIAEIARHI
ncbi:MAG: aspartate/glutamate racemase family protein [Pseudomonadota bacterium]